MDFSKLVQKILTKKHITQEALALAIGGDASRQIVGKWVRGEVKNPGLYFKNKIIEIYNKEFPDEKIQTLI